MKRLALILPLLLILTACSVSINSDEPVVVVLATETPTETATVTATPTVTNTPTNTATPTATWTPLANELTMTAMADAATERAATRAAEETAEAIANPRDLVFTVDLVGVVGESITSTNGVECRGRTQTPYRELRSRTEVQVFGPGGRVFWAGEFVNGTATDVDGDAMTCVFTFTAPDLPELAEYTVQIGDDFAWTYTYNDLASVDFSITATVQAE